RIQITFGGCSSQEAPLVEIGVLRDDREPFGGGVAPDAVVVRRLQTHLADMCGTGKEVVEGRAVSRRAERCWSRSSLTPAGRRRTCVPGPPQRRGRRGCPRGSSRGGRGGFRLRSFRRRGIPEIGRAH